jgi:hypothetical protein
MVLVARAAKKLGQAGASAMVASCHNSKAAWVAVFRVSITHAKAAVMPSWFQSHSKQLTHNRALP